MKRAQDSLSTSASQTSPVAKKLRITPPESPVNDTSKNYQAADNVDGGWTKVEKRKGKKAKRVAGKLDVCVSNQTPSQDATHTALQANPARFLYNKGEILKRREAVTINVCTVSQF